MYCGTDLIIFFLCATHDDLKNLFKFLSLERREERIKVLEATQQEKVRKKIILWISKDIIIIQYQIFMSGVDNLHDIDISYFCMFNR